MEDGIYWNCNPTYFTGLAFTRLKVTVLYSAYTTKVGCFSSVIQITQLFCKYCIKAGRRGSLIMNDNIDHMTDNPACSFEDRCEPLTDSDRSLYACTNPWGFTSVQRDHDGFTFIV